MHTGIGDLLAVVQSVETRLFGVERVRGGVVQLVVCGVVVQAVDVSGIRIERPFPLGGRIRQQHCEIHVVLARSAGCRHPAVFILRTCLRVEHRLGAVCARILVGVLQVVVVPLAPAFSPLLAHGKARIEPHRRIIVPACRVARGPNLPACGIPCLGAGVAEGIRFAFDGGDGQVEIDLFVEQRPEQVHAQAVAHGVAPRGLRIVLRFVDALRIEHFAQRAGAQLRGVGVSEVVIYTDPCPRGIRYRIGPGSIFASCRGVGAELPGKTVGQRGGQFDEQDGFRVVVLGGSGQHELDLRHVARLDEVHRILAFGVYHAVFPVVDVDLGNRRILVLQFPVAGIHLQFGDLAHDLHHPHAPGIGVGGHVVNQPVRFAPHELPGLDLDPLHLDAGLQGYFSEILPAVVEGDLFREALISHEGEPQLIIAPAGQADGKAAVGIGDCRRGLFSVLVQRDHGGIGQRLAVGRIDQPTDDVAALLGCRAFGRQQRGEQAKHEQDLSGEVLHE